MKGLIKNQLAAALKKRGKEHASSQLRLATKNCDRHLNMHTVDDNETNLKIIIALPQHH